jgi:ubiquinol-cytochrome c reductase cytochrome b subunit
MSRMTDWLEARLAFRRGLRPAMKRLFPEHWSFLLGEVALFSFLGLVLSGVYLAFFYRASAAPVVYHGGYPSYEGRLLPDAFASVLELSTSVPFGLVVRRFHHFAAHLFVGSLLVHAARVYFTGAFRYPREITWWIGLVLFVLAIVNGFSGYCLPFDVRGGSAIRMLMTTLQSVPWMGAWLATFTFGAPFPGPFILNRLFIEHVFIGPALIAALVGAHLFLVVWLNHTQFRGPGVSSEHEVGARLWPEQTARSTTLMLIVWGACALLSVFFPVEAVWAYGPFQALSSYEPLTPDWYLMWIEGAYRLIPRQLDFHLIGANFTNPFYGTVVLSIVVLGMCAIYPFVDRRIYRDQFRGDQILDRPGERPFRTAFGLAGCVFLVLLSLCVLDNQMAAVTNSEVWQVHVVWGPITLGVPPLVFFFTLWRLRAARRIAVELRTPPPALPAPEPSRPPAGTGLAATRVR